MLDRLRAYKAVHKNCDVPSDFEEDPKLVRWVKAQRTQKENGTLSLERIQKLEAENFSWRIRETRRHTWEERYEELREFKTRFDHCDVAQDWSENVQLGRWVNAQRHLRKKNTMSTEHIALLDVLGFSWRLDK